MEEDWSFSVPTRRCPSGRGKGGIWRVTDLCERVACSRGVHPPRVSRTQDVEDPDLLTCDPAMHNGGQDCIGAAAREAGPGGHGQRARPDSVSSSPLSCRLPPSPPPERP